jgi:hypothetical protein
LLWHFAAGRGLFWASSAKMPESRLDASAGDSVSSCESARMEFSGMTPICCRTFTPAALPEYPAASLRDYCSGAFTAKARLGLGDHFGAFAWLRHKKKGPEEIPGLRNFG